MCGIFGTLLPIDDTKLISIQHLLNHRGPDSYGIERISLKGATLTFLHTRLAIQDLSSNGHQPMFSQCSNWCITFNGEIYNHFELRNKLDIKFNGTSDTETIVEHLAKFGLVDTIKKLNGIFAFAAYNFKEQKLYLVRDHFGIKPLYYCDNNALSFSSEIKPLIKLQDGNVSINNNGLEQFLSLRFVPSPNTLIEGIKRLPPGHYLEFDIQSSSSSLVCFVTPTSAKFTGSIVDATHQYENMLKTAVTRQLLSDVPVGVLLSGGIDSAVVAAIAREHNSDLSSYTVGFGNHHEECEIDDAAITASTLGIRHEFVTVTPESLLDSLPEIVRSIEEPLGTTSIMPMWHLTKKAKESVTVVLTGQGNDEPWGGYRRYQLEMLLEKMPLLKHLPFGSPEFLTTKIKNEGFRRGLRSLGISDTASRFKQAYALFSDDDVHHLMKTNTSTTSTSSISYWLKWLDSQPELSDTERMMRIDTRMNLADDLLLYGDKTSMAVALEARVPMLDPELVNFIESLPLKYRSTLRKTKIVHKLMAKSYLPSEIIHRKKKGFEVPFEKWSKTIWRDFIEANLLDKNLKVFTFLDFDYVNTIWRCHLSSKPDYSRQIFALLMLSLWAEEYL